MAGITQAGLLGAHPSVQDLNIATSPTTNNPTKQYHMQQFRNMNALFRGDDFSTAAYNTNSNKNLCAPTGGPRIVAVRNEENIRKGIFKQQQFSGRNNNSVVVMTGSSGRPLAKEEETTTPVKHNSVPPLYNNNNNVASSPQNLPPRSPSLSNAKNNNSTTNNNMNMNKSKVMSLPQLLKHAHQKRRLGGAAGNKTPSEISLVTSVESRDASTNHPCSETVYSCQCCRPKKPGTFGAPPVKCKNHSSSVCSYSTNDDDDDDDDYSLYDNLTSVSQRGTNQQAYKLVAEMPREQNITARQIFELQQAKAAASGSYGHNQSKKAGGHIGGGVSGRNPMGFGLASQRVLDRATNRGMSARTGVSEVSSLTHTTNVSKQQQQQQKSVVSISGSRVSVSTSKVSSTAVRKLEEALEQERADRLKTEEQISKIRERQERLMSRLTPEERRKMQELLDGGGDE